MTESQFCQKLLRALRAHPQLKDAVIWKLNDRTTRGIPDFVVTTAEGRTTWWEVKVAPNDLTKIQKHYLAKLRFSWTIVLRPDGCVAVFPQGVAIKVHYFFSGAVEEIVRRCVDA